MNGSRQNVRCKRSETYYAPWPVIIALLDEARRLNERGVSVHVASNESMKRGLITIYSPELVIYLLPLWLRRPVIEALRPYDTMTRMDIYLHSNNPRHVPLFNIEGANFVHETIGVCEFELYDWLRKLSSEFSYSRTSSGSLWPDGDGGFWLAAQGHAIRDLPKVLQFDLFQFLAIAGVPKLILDFSIRENCWRYYLIHFLRTEL